MTGTDREDGRVFVRRDGMEPGQRWVLSHQSVLRPTASRVPRDLVEAGHGFYLAAVNCLFVRRAAVPSRLFPVFSRSSLADTTASLSEGSGYLKACVDWVPRRCHRHKR